MILRKKIQKIHHRLYPYLAYPIDSLIAKKLQLSPKKVFCIGLNKTGTTSLEKVLAEMGYLMGNQRKGELLLEDWLQKDFKRILKFCETAEAFQDSPFSLPKTYEQLEQHFPEAKFILSVRDNADQWYNSLIKFHSKLFANGERTPTFQDLKEAFYIKKGRLSKTLPLIFKTSPADSYNKERLIDYYEQHEKDVHAYFADKPQKLISINLSNPSDYRRLCHFLDKPTTHKTFPWLNKTSISITY